MINYLEKIALIFSIISLPIWQTFGNNSWNEFKNIGVTDGLPYHTINDLLQDNEGYIWIASNNGLIKYDGQQYKVYKDNPGCPEGVKGQQILKLFEDTKNRLWIGTNRALNLYNSSTDQITPIFFYKENTRAEKLSIIDICEYNDSTFLIATDGGGLFQFNPQSKLYQQIELHGPPQTSDDYLYIKNLLIDQKRNIWFTSTKLGLIKFDIHSHRISPTAARIAQKAGISALSSFGENIILIGTYGDGLWQYNTKSDSISRYIWEQKPSVESLKFIHDIKYIPEENTLYIGTHGEGLIKYNPGDNRVTQYVHSNKNMYSIANNIIKSILIDSENNIWLGHDKGGISFALNHSPFHNIYTYSTPSCQIDNHWINCIVTDIHGSIIIGTNGGGVKCLKQDGTVVPYLNKTGNLSEDVRTKSVLALLKDKSKNIWIGTHLNGVYIKPADNGPIKHLTKEQLSGNDIRCFYEDDNGNVWIGTYDGGVNIYNPSTNTISYPLGKKKGISHSTQIKKITSIQGDSYGWIWIGTPNGLFKYDSINQSYAKYHFAIEEVSVYQMIG